ncbi:MAG: DUF1707 and DUF2154 domain-containing protein [Pseudonocardia sp.]|uniref:DUF1707 SHOCT-like domain-containing protein n=1 Tax=unclassified Pseudonocardia TaxID=2619320 RepID=UPI00086CA05F|nr:MULTISPECIES: DUF1707 domain-containing protein [unclassified Pseudonocardia]MBN9108252.1 DUF1707 and DUF2154 domain-containing protein [Pseudonocardia sp.]ODU11363.1 MAG: hypothetical protein ABS80_22600 [Pseudonocardia sp. SCN 72-51]ODV08808.1 MAG: hypothetical protein ABT15_02140 [Pseudonocardia sp. SCN 73-27]
MTVAQPPDAQPPESLDPARRTTQDQLERAVGEGRLTLDEFTDRSALVWKAQNAGELDAVVADLPAAPVVGATSPARSTLVSVIGDIRRRGRWGLRRKTTAILLIGDVELDLRGAVVTEQGTEPVTVDVWSVIGDTEVVVPDGVEAELVGFTLLGDRRVDLAPVPRVPGTPVVRIRVFSLLGDAKLRSG